MSHHQAAIFSPSVARAAASAAKDWSYIDSWLSSKYAPRAPPSFERNADTLKVLLALAAHNEAADEERDQLASIEATALHEVRDFEDQKEKRQAADAERENLNGEQVADEILAVIEDGLSREGKAALDAMTNMAVEVGMAYPTPEALSTRYVDLQCQAFELEQMIERVDMVQHYLDRESIVMKNFIEELHGDEYQPPTDLAKRNLELQRKVKTMSAKLPELKRQLEHMQETIKVPNLTVEDLRKDEEDYLALLAAKKDLDAQVKAFAGLPPDVEAARVELEGLRSELRQATERRDTVFEGLVERSSPVKVRRRP